MTKNLDWELSARNLVTFKKWDGINDEKFQYYGSSLKNPNTPPMYEKTTFGGRGGGG